MTDEGQAIQVASCGDGVGRGVRLVARPVDLLITGIVDLDLHVHVALKSYLSKVFTI